MSGRVWDVVLTSPHVLHPAHGWGFLARTPRNSEKEGPRSEAEHRQKTQPPPNMTKSFIGSKMKICPSQKLFHPPPVDNDRKRLLKVSILTKSLVFIA
jgi:hypothetical protein